MYDWFFLTMVTYFNYVGTVMYGRYRVGPDPGLCNRCCMRGELYILLSSFRTDLGGSMSQWFNGVCLYLLSGDFYVLRH